MAKKLPASAASPASSTSHATSPPLDKEEQVTAPLFNLGLCFYLAWISLMIIVLMAALDATSLSVALSSIAQELRGTAIEAFWAGASFLLTGTVFQPIVGSLSGIFGRKPVLLTSPVLFLIGAIVAVVAGRVNDAMTVMLISRSIQGVGGGGIIVLAEILPTDLVPLRLRGNYLAMIGAMWALGSVGGPLVGGALSTVGNWPWIFWINLPFIAVGGTMILASLKLNNLSGSLASKLRRIDYVGIVLFLSSTTGLLITLTRDGVMYSRSSWRTLVPLLVSAAGLVLFALWEEKFAVEPLIPLRITKNISSDATFITPFLHVTGVGTGHLFPGLDFSIQAGSSEEDTAAAVAFFTFMRTFGQAVGVAVGGVVSQNAFRNEIASRPLIAANAASWASDPSALVRVLHALPDGQIRADLIESYADALKIVWMVCCAFAGLALLLTFTIKEYTLDRALESKQQFVEGSTSGLDLDGSTKA
ncbi:hypothetical protein CAC42_3550 [Sphaceloma murrayae]|uniref:Major facilitator superfamily (MFS) profile domain-containing protein n=1 Tax=Sphaceloma murrayae TaxID=2082308 RepID=A0A2K1R1Q7_9PEZI|nr:hypothetical protein CAC42_3550 [Sphaceloma murrayae]